MIETLHKIDTQLFLWLNSLHSDMLDSFMYDYSGKWVWGILYATILYAMIRTWGWRRGMLIALGAILVVTLADQTCASLLRPEIQRLRPTHPDNPISDLVHTVAGYRGGVYGFPSCHAANTMGAAMFISLIFRQRSVGAFMFFWALLNCYSRIYLGVHYPGDLLIGTIIGLFWGTIVWLICRYLLTIYATQGFTHHPHTHTRHIGPFKVTPPNMIPMVGITITIALLLKSIL